MIRVEYIGLKPVKTDNVAGTGTVWSDAGDVQEVSPEAWAKLRPYDTVWREASEVVADDFGKTDADQVATLPLETAGSLADATPPDAFQYVLQRDGEPDVVLDTMDLGELKAFNNQHKLGVDNRIKKVEAFREALFTAATKG